MKKRTSVIALAAALMVPNIGASAEEAYRSNQEVLVNSQNVNISAYNIEGYNYFRLRDIAEALDNTQGEFAISYDEESKSILVDTKGQYDHKESVKPELEEFADGSKSDQALIVDGQEVNVANYNINDHNYFNLRELGQVLGFEVDYVKENRQVLINSQPVEEYDLVVEAASDEIIQLGEEVIVEEVEEVSQVPVEEVVEPVVEEGPSAYEQQVENFVQAALNKLGTPYSQIDCSSLVKIAMLDSGIDPGAKWVSTRNIPTLPSLYEIPMSELRRGDVLNTRYPEAHAMIYIGDRKVVEAQPRGGIVIRDVRTKNYKAYRLVDQTI